MESHAVVVLLALVMCPTLMSPLADAMAAPAAFRQCCALNAVTMELPRDCRTEQKLIHCTPLITTPDELRLLP